MPRVSKPRCSIGHITAVQFGAQARNASTREPVGAHATLRPTLFTMTGRTLRSDWHQYAEIISREVSIVGRSFCGGGCGRLPPNEGQGNPSPYKTCWVAALPAGHGPRPERRRYYSECFSGAARWGLKGAAGHSLGVAGRRRRKRFAPITNPGRRPGLPFRSPSAPFGSAGYRSSLPAGASRPNHSGNKEHALPSRAESAP
jgi:hypothetical protein